MQSWTRSRSMVRSRGRSVAVAISGRGRGRPVVVGFRFLSQNLSVISAGGVRGGATPACCCTLSCARL
jgi:hypothetical protein